MPYRETIFKAHNYFHIFCRGNDKRDIFLDPSDYERFLSRMSKYRRLQQISIICYCLMPNHFHFLLRQDTSKSISYFMHKLMVSYAMYFNKRYQKTGHLFESSFKARFINNDEYLLHLSRYIHLNPLKMLGAQMKVETYPWSTYLEYLNNKKGICKKEIILQQFNFPNHIEGYRDFVNETSMSGNIDIIVLENF